MLIVSTVPKFQNHENVPPFLVGLTYFQMRDVLVLEEHFRNKRIQNTPKLRGGRVAALFSLAEQVSLRHSGMKSDSHVIISNRDRGPNKYKYSKHIL